MVWLVCCGKERKRNQLLVIWGDKRSWNWCKNGKLYRSKIKNIITCRQSGRCARMKGRNLTSRHPGKTPSDHASLGSAQTGGQRSVLTVSLHFIKMTKGLFLSGEAALTSASRKATFSSSSVITRSLSWITIREFWSCRWANMQSNSEWIPLQYAARIQVFAFQRRHVALTCSIMCLTFLCWLFSMSSRWWIFSFRTDTSFSSRLALKVHTEIYNTRTFSVAPCADGSSLTSLPSLALPPSSCADCSVPPRGCGWSPAGWRSPAPSLPAASAALVCADLSSRCLLPQSSTCPAARSGAPSVCSLRSVRRGHGGCFTAVFQWCRPHSFHLDEDVTCSLSFSSWCFFSASWSCAYKRLLTSLRLARSASSSTSWRRKSWGISAGGHVSLFSCRRTWSDDDVMCCVSERVCRLASL